MAVTNLHLARTLSGQPLELEYIRIGVAARFPSGAGGSIECICTESTDTHATFESKSKDWPRKWRIDVGAKDLTLADFRALSEALQAYSSMGLPTDAQRAVVVRAAALGYAALISHTQASWLQAGLDTQSVLEGAVEQAMNETGGLDTLLHKCCETEDAYELRDSIGDMSDADKGEALMRTLTKDLLGL